MADEIDQWKNMYRTRAMAKLFDPSNCAFVFDPPNYTLDLFSKKPAVKANPVEIVGESKLTQDIASLESTKWSIDMPTTETLSVITDLRRKRHDTSIQSVTDEDSINVIRQSLDSNQDVYDSFASGFLNFQSVCAGDSKNMQPTITLDTFLRYRLLDVEEILYARLKNTSFLSHWIDSGVGIAYKAKCKDRFKLVVPCSIDLIRAALDPRFNKPYLPINYDAITAKEFFVDKNYNQGLTDIEVVGQEALLYLVHGNRKILLDMHRLIQAKKGFERSMGFYTIDKAFEEDALTLVSVANCNFSSNGYFDGATDLTDKMKFLRAVQKVK